MTAGTRASAAWSPEERLAAFVAACGGAISVSGKETRCRCPVHGGGCLDVAPGENGGIVIICRAGCTTEDICKRVGWELSDLMPPSTSTPRPPRKGYTRQQERETDRAAKCAAKPKAKVRYMTALDVSNSLARSRGGKLIEHYVYTRDGKPVGVVARVLLPDGKKEMPQGRCDEGWWTWGGMDKPYPLFGADEMLAAVRAAGIDPPPVQFHEGCKKAILARALGFVAVSTAGGAGKAKFSDLSSIKGLVVHLFPDNDKVGREHVADLAARLYAHGAAAVWIVTLPDLPERGDICDFVDAHRKLGAENEQLADEIRDAIANAVEVPAPAAGFPVSPEIEEPTAKPYPVAALPPALRAIVEHGSAAQGVDVAYWTVLLLPILAGCVGATRRVRLRRDWCEPAVIWAAPVAPSGSGKSPPMRTLLQPVRERDHELHLQTEEKQRQHAAQCARWAEADKGTRGDRPPPPPMLAAIVSDITTEALAVRLADNPRGLLLAVDELAGWLRGFDRYRRGGGDEQTWLSIHSADPIKIDRKSKESGPARIYVKHAAVSVVGTIQPGIAMRYLGDAERRESGTAARMLLARPPVTAAKLSDDEIPIPVLADYARVIRSLLDLRLGNDGEPRDLPLSPAARERYRTWHYSMAEIGAHAATEKGGRGDDTAAVCSKLRGYAPRIALLLALARAAETGEAELLQVVDEGSMIAATAICDWHYDQAMGIYAEWAAEANAASQDAGTYQPDDTTALAERLAGILGHGPHTIDELHTATGKNFKGEQIRAALEILRTGDRAECDKGVGPSGGRPRETWRLIAGGGVVP